MLRGQENDCLNLLNYFDHEDWETIFIDESSCDAWNKYIRIWMDKSRPFNLDLPPSRGSGVNIFGAISNRQKAMRYTLIPVKRRLRDQPILPEDKKGKPISDNAFFVLTSSLNNVF